MLAFTRFVCGNLVFWVGMIRLFPMLLKFRLGLLNHTVAKIRWLRYFFAGKSHQELTEQGKAFAQNRLPNLLRKAAMDRLQWHQDQGHSCFLVTASLALWTKAWAEAHGLILVASQGEFVDGVFTGQLLGKNCWGKEKRNRVEAIIQDQPTHMIYAYGDSQGDEALLQWADKAYFKPFRTAPLQST